MGLTTKVYTNSLSNQAINSALLIGTYTNSKRVRKVYTKALLDQVAGNGAYSLWVKIQRAGAGSAYVTVKCSYTAASGETAVALYTPAIVLEPSDVMTIYCIGLAGDTTTPDIIAEVHEEYTAAQPNMEG